MKFEVSIQDFGCGISPEKLEGLFINFNNLEEHRKANPTGRGLGLSICKMIVEQMGGTVDVKSKVGYGSTFSITFKAMCKIPEAQSLLSVPEQILQPQVKKKVSSSIK
jgi:signal transduction histidine kinase